MSYIAHYYYSSVVLEERVVLTVFSCFDNCMLSAGIIVIILFFVAWSTCM